MILSNVSWSTHPSTFSPSYFLKRRTEARVVLSKCPEKEVFELWLVCIRQLLSSLFVSEHASIPRTRRANYKLTMSDFFIFLKPFSSFSLRIPCCLIWNNRSRSCIAAAFEWTAAPVPVLKCICWCCEALATWLIVSYGCAVSSELLLLPGASSPLS